VTRQQPRDGPPAQALVVVGASAGGVEALTGFVRGFPADLDYTVLVILHLAADSPSVLPEILARNSPLPVHRAVADEPLRGGHIYVAAPNRHLLVEDSRLHLSDAPKENGHRPAVDPAMRSAAAAFGPAVVGVLLSGTRDDGAAGLLEVKQAGGAVVVQDPDEALYDGMPRAALRHVEVDAVLPVSAMGAWLARRSRATVVASLPDVRQPAMTDSPERPPADPVSDLDLSARDPRDAIPDVGGDGTRFTCPECGGVLFANEHSRLLRFNCSVGHAYSLDSLNAANAESVEEALWTAIRTLEDRVALLSRMAARARGDGHQNSAARFEKEGRDLVDRSAKLRAALEGLGGADAA
jgi:two-component system, chemotaxis family, protein-glutamate methylesterase/glutaminase